jgi:hypothetical protein
MEISDNVFGIHDILLCFYVNIYIMRNLDCAHVSVQMDSL